MVETNLLSLSYGKVKRRDIDAKGGLLPESFEGYNIVEDGDIVLRFTDLQNDQRSLRTGLVTERGIITSAYTTVRPAEYEMARFLHYALHAYDVRKGFYGMGSGVRQGLKWQEAKYIRLPMPGIDEQQRIADYLDDKCAEIDKAIAAAEASIEELKAYRQSALEDVISEWWEKSSPIKLKYVLREMKEKSADGVGEPLSITIARGVLLSSEIDVPFSAESKVGAKVVHAGDLVFNKLKAYFGVMYVSPYDGLVSPDYAVYRTIEGVADAKYIEYMVHTQRVIDEFIIRISGVADGFRRLYTDDLFDITVNLPSLSEQRQIIAYLDELYAGVAQSVAAKQSIIDDLKAYKQSLVYEVVTGKREV